MLPHLVWTFQINIEHEVSLSAVLTYANTRVCTNLLDVETHAPQQAIAVGGNVQSRASLIAKFGRLEELHFSSAEKREQTVRATYCHFVTLLSNCQRRRL